MPVSELRCVLRTLFSSEAHRSTLLLPRRNLDDCHDVPDDISVSKLYPIVRPHHCESPSPSSRGMNKKRPFQCPMLLGRGQLQPIRGARAARTIATRATMFELEKPYKAPSWANKLQAPSHGRVRLGQFPTAIHRWDLPRLPPGCEVFIKRDDLSGMQLSGNKVRKLEFLLAEAKATGCDSVITIGGIQSNHCRATAVASRYLGLDPFLILRNSRTGVDSDPGLTGNLLVERLCGGSVHQVTKEEYTKVGSVALCAQLEEKLREMGRKPYVIPVGGSNALGSWGYVEFVRELADQSRAMSLEFTDLVMACGSGGTTAGIALGCRHAEMETAVRAYGVCDDPAYFYDYCDEILCGMGATPGAIGAASSGLFEAVQAKGSGYAISTQDELKVVKEVAESTGVILDPVYSGKALFAFMRDLESDPGRWENRKVLFLHTGGLLGMYDKTDQLMSIMDEKKVARLDVNLSV